MKIYFNNEKILSGRFWRIIVFLVIIVVLSYVAYSYRSSWAEKNEIKNAEKSVQDIPKIEEPLEETPPIINKETTIDTADVAPPVEAKSDLPPTSALIKMSFTTQSPLAVWDATQEDACEEASIIMVAHYLNKTSVGSKNEAEKEILDLIDYETKNSYGPSITLNELNTIAKSYYNLTGKVKTDISVEDIKKEITKGNPVIIPAAGKILPNPNFRNGGPNYHMLVIKGYDKNGFITNDPGTRKGENFRYTFDALFNAIHDWDPNNILNGQKAYLTLSK
jgi:uncharacterized protein YvpB